jgi:hypothetical protein
MRRGYCLSCYAPGAYVFSVPLRASTAWLKKVLRRRDLINATPLRRSQFEILSRRVAQPTEVGWYSELDYFLEAFQMGAEPDHSRQPTPGVRPAVHRALSARRGGTER